MTEPEAVAAPAVVAVATTRAGHRVRRSTLIVSVVVTAMAAVAGGWALGHGGVFGLGDAHCKDARSAQGEFDKQAQAKIDQLQAMVDSRRIVLTSADQSAKTSLPLAQWAQASGGPDDWLTIQAEARTLLEEDALVMRQSPSCFAAKNVAQAESVLRTLQQWSASH